METLAKDLRYAARRLARTPLFTLLSLVTLALGIGANTAIFSVVNAVLLQPLQFGDPSQLDQIHTTRLGDHVPISGPDFLQMQEETRAYRTIAAYTGAFPNLTGDGEPVRLNGASVSAAFFEVLGVRPLLGRSFASDENEPGRHRVAVLGHALWQQRFGADAGVVGRVVTLDGEPFEVVGVMPAGFDFPGESEIWVPLQFTPGFGDDANRAAHFLSAVGRRHPGVDTERAAADIAGIAARIEQAFPDLKTGFGGTAVALEEQLLGDIRTPLLVLLGAVGLVLLIACANVANLLLARSAGRQSELAIRAALGAERTRLVRQLITESLLLGLLGGALGLLLSVWGTAWLIELRPEGIPRLDEVRVDGPVVGFTLALSLLTGLLFGLLPAYHVTRGNLVASINQGGRGAIVARGATRTRNILVVLETSLAVMLLVSAGLLIRSFVRLSSVELGFRAEQALVFDVALPGASYPGPDETRGFYSLLEERLAGLPGVSAVGATSSVPLSGYYSGGPMLIEGRGEPRPGEENIVQIRAITPDLLDALGMPLLSGRPFTPQDRFDAPPVVLLTEAAAAHFFGGEDPLGQRVAMAGAEEPQWAEVVGIVGDVRGVDVTQAGEPGIYFPHSQVPVRQMSLVVRTAGEPSALLPAVRRELQAIDPDLPMVNERTVAQIVGDAVSQSRFYMLLLSIFAATALILSAIGIFGVMSYVVVQRTREIGIRMALGAAPQRVLLTVVGGAAALAIAGVALGLAGALAGSRILGSLLYEISATDPLTLSGVAVSLTAVAVAASYLPARRAVQVDPMVALRRETV